MGTERPIRSEPSKPALKPKPPRSNWRRNRRKVLSQIRAAVHRSRATPCQARDPVERPPSDPRRLLLDTTVAEGGCSAHLSTLRVTQRIGGGRGRFVSGVTDLPCAAAIGRNVRVEVETGQPDLALRRPGKAARLRGSQSGPLRSRSKGLTG